MLLPQVASRRLPVFRTCGWRKVTPVGLYRSMQGENDAGSLERLGAIAEAFGADKLAADANSLAERVAEGRFFVACVGQFKRGKSTLLDALIGESLLPTGIVPVTTVPTVVRYGAQRSARARSAGGAWFDVPPAD